MLPRHVATMLAHDGFRPAHPAAQGAASEAEYTGLKVRVLSAPKARAYRPGPREVAISIRGPRERVVPLSPRFAAVLPLVFDDMGIFAMPSAEGGGTAETMTAAQADAVVAFIRAHVNAATLVIHCTAGVSRSRSLAAAVCAALQLPYGYTTLNEDVYAAVTHAFSRAGERSPPARGSQG